jgi:acyl carrier protein
MSEVQSKVVEIIVDKLGVKESEVTPEASFTNHLGADSLDTVELIMEFEKAFDILTRMQRRSLPLATLSPISRHTRNNLRFFQPANLKALNL